MRDLQLAEVYQKFISKTQDMRKDQVIDGEHENKMQVSFAIKGFCEMGFMY